MVDSIFHPLLLYFSSTRCRWLVRFWRTRRQGWTGQHFFASGRGRRYFFRGGAGQGSKFTGRGIFGAGHAGAGRGRGGVNNMSTLRSMSYSDSEFSPCNIHFFQLSFVNHDPFWRQFWGSSLLYLQHLPSQSRSSALPAGLSPLTETGLPQRW